MPLLRPIDAGLEAFPEVTLTPEETAAVARGQFVSPAAGSARPVRPLPAARPGRRARRPSRARPAAGSPRTRSSSPRRRPRRRPGPDAGMRVVTGVDRLPAAVGPASSSSSASSTGSTWAIATSFDTSSPRPRRRDAAPDRHHVRPPPRRGPDRQRAAAPDRPRRASRAPRRGGRGGHRRPALRRCPAPHALRRLRRADPRPRPVWRVPHDA